MSPSSSSSHSLFLTCASLFPLRTLYLMPFPSLFFDTTFPSACLPSIPPPHSPAPPVSLSLPCTPCLSPQSPLIDSKASEACFYLIKWPNLSHYPLTNTKIWPSSPPPPLAPSSSSPASCSSFPPLSPRIFPISFRRMFSPHYPQKTFRTARMRGSYVWGEGKKRGNEVRCGRKTEREAEN